MKKQTLTICLVLLLLGALPVRAANDHSYTLSDVGITLTMPDQGAVFTRDLREDDPNLALYGTTKDAFLSLMEAQNIYLSEISPDFTQEITVTAVDCPFPSLILGDPQDLDDLVNLLCEDNTDAEIYPHTQSLFIKTHFQMDDESGSSDVLQYSTINNYQCIYINFFSYDGQVTAAEETMMDELVDSVVFDTVSQQSAFPVDEATSAGKADESSSFEYIDETTGATFLVPGNWIELSLPALFDSITAEFTSPADPDSLILYSSLDLWAEVGNDMEFYALSPSGLDAWCRDNIDYCLSNLLRMEDPDPTLCTYGNQTYYTVTHTSEELTNYIQVPLTITHMVSFHNGYLFWFQFLGDSTAPLYTDFETLLASFRPESTASPPRAAVTSLLPYFITALVVILLLIVLLVILRRRKKAARGIAAGAVPAAPLDGTDSKWQNAGSTQDLPQSGVELLEQLRDEMEAQQAASTPQSGIELLEQLRDEMEAASAAPPSGKAASGAPSDPAAAAPPSTPESSKPPQENPRDPA